MVMGVVVILLAACGSAPPCISVEPTTQDLGQVPQKFLEATYTIRNQGGSALRIDKISTSCECTEATIDQDTIPPGGSAPLRVTMDPVEDNLYGNLVRLIYIQSNDPTTPEVTVELRVSILKATAPPTPPSLPAALAEAAATRSPAASSTPAAPDKPTPSSLPALTSVATLDPISYSLPKPVGAMQDRLPPPDVPACLGAKSLEKAIDFSWEKRDESDWREVHTRTSEQNWTYYRCDQPLAAAVAFYRQWMVSPLYGWLEDHVEEYPEGALLVDKRPWECTMYGHRWVYLWLLPEASNKEVTDLVAVWYDYSPY